MHVHRLQLLGTNAYVISGEHHVLIDTGAARDRVALLDGLAQLGLGGDDLSLVLLTHAHATSAGNASYLQHMFHVPVAVHGADAPILASGLNRRGRVRSLAGALVRHFGEARFEAAAPDVVFGHTLSLEPFGCRGSVVHTPGHTMGSVSVVLPGGDALVGDLLMGGAFGGRLLSHVPARHYTAEAPQRVARSLALLERLGVERLHPGTGETLAMADVRRRIIDAARDTVQGPAPARLRERRLREEPAMSVANR